MEEYLIIVGLTCLGWACGKLINLFADVSQGKAFDTKRTCDYCGRYRPVIHYFSILYSCPYCSAPYPRRVWLVDILSTVATLLMAFFISDLRVFFFAWMVLIYFGTTIITDIERHTIHRQINLYGAILCSALGYQLSGLRITIIGGMTGFLLMAVVYGFGIFYFRIIDQKRTGGEYPSAIGFGDVFLCGNLGLLIGFPKIIPAICFGILAAGMFGLCMILFQRIYSRSSARINWVPMSPFFILSAVLIECLRVVMLSS